MASVSFVGPLVSAESDKGSPDIWYLSGRCLTPTGTSLRVVRLFAASSSRYNMCTVIFALNNVVESACADQHDVLDKQTSGLPCLGLHDTPVSFLRVFVSEQRWNWHSGKFLHEDDCPSRHYARGAARDRSQGPQAPVMPQEPRESCAPAAHHLSLLSYVHVGVQGVW